MLSHIAFGREMQGVGGQFMNQCVPWWPAPAARDKELCAELWRVTEKMLAADFEAKLLA